MSTKTTKLKLTLPAESDVASINDINGNMNIIDSLTHVTTSGIASSTITSEYGATPWTATANWNYKKYDDGTFSAYCKIETTDLLCNGASDVGEAYWSGVIKVTFPSIGITGIRDCQMHVSGNCMNWVMNITGKSVLDYVRCRLAGIYNEGTYNAQTNNLYKQLFIHIEGTWSA